MTWISSPVHVCACFSMHAQCSRTHTKSPRSHTDGNADHAHFPLWRPCGSGANCSMVRGKICNAAACLSATTPLEWNQTFIFSMFAIFAVAASAPHPYHSFSGCLLNVLWRKFLWKSFYTFRIIFATCLSWTSWQCLYQMICASICFHSDSCSCNNQNSVLFGPVLILPVLQWPLHADFIPAWRLCLLSKSFFCIASD